MSHQILEWFPVHQDIFHQLFRTMCIYYHWKVSVEQIEKGHQNEKELILIRVWPQVIQLWNEPWR